ncbi:NAD(P)-dependent alcohol dehydrogenase [Nocardioides donggukensis]|uniref:NAD(P)-dependent alcohol dehydrogenase n=1 Tax=Nocardioides donggukensis TaxID=2774019 RepID=A0A927PZQ0_9ACTN|nr:NAD(P)-dependent alcohol dehydrogenase [Nocardioides donggukensis]MBD8870598.1 NAD(P)-dependent alcohol dehydrogenase [Nocardioides donggukensis]
MATQLPDTVQAVHHSHYGPPAHLAQRRIAMPTPPAEQVVLRVRAAGINRGDALAVEGLPYAARLSYGFPRPKRSVPGTDVAGTVVAVGRAVTGWRPGDAVTGWAKGAFAEYTTASASSLLAMPEGVTFEEAAATPTSAVTALQALRAGGIATARRVLVIGASGGVGSFAVQLAAAYGAEVTGVCSTRNVSLIRSFGAHHVVDYVTQDVTSCTGHDLVVDLVGKLPLVRARRMATRDGCYVVVGGGTARTLTGMRRFAAAALLSPLGPQRIRPLFATPKRADLATVLSYLASGQVRPFVEAAYALRDTADAIDFVSRGKARGRVVLVA